MLDRVKRTIDTYGMLAPGERVLLALSGGADSVALLRTLLALGYKVWAFHLNHCLRGAESDRDEAFCRALCASFGVSLTAEHVDVKADAAAHGESIETAARRLRYERLEALAAGDRIATAHTADDSVETMLFHLARGTGPKGLAGIPPVRGAIIRPLIETGRTEIEAYLSEIGQAYMTDSTNASGDYTRNRIRHEVVPVLRTVNPAFAENAGRLSRLLRQDETYLQAEADCLLARAAQDGGWQTETLRGAHPAIRSRALRRLLADSGVPPRDTAETHITLADGLLLSENPSAALDLPGGVTLRREYNLLRAEKTEKTVPWAPVSVKIPLDVCLWDGKTRLTVRRLEKNEDFYNSFNTFCVDCGTISFETLVIRPRQTGDRLRLSEKGGSRTLKRLMIDRRIPRLRRHLLAVLADENGVIAVQDVGADISRAPRGGERLEIKFEG